jgi:hypothetical protein
MAIIAIDPGKATGYAVYHPEYASYDSNDNFVSDEYDDQFVFLDFFNSYASKMDEVVCEAYIITPETLRKSRQNYSLEIIGAVKWICHRLEIPFTLQTPAQGKAFGTDEKLKRIGWWSPGQGHANDAARHALTYAVSKGIFPEGLVVDADV